MFNHKVKKPQSLKSGQISCVDCEMLQLNIVGKI